MSRFFIFLGVLLCASCAQETPVEPNRVDEPSVDSEEPWLVWDLLQPDWVEPAEPFNVIENIYYVGTKGLGSYLITSEEGHILLDGALPQSASLISDNIKTLGFDIKDVEILLNSHAHFDHSGGLAALKKQSGAKLIAHAGDVSALENGTYLGYEDKANLSAPPVKVDQRITDGAIVEIGGTRLTANLTPGHTRGCTSWTMTVVHNTKPLDVVFFCSASVAANSLVPEQYEGIAADYRKTFDKVGAWQPDIPLAFHDEFFDLWGKRNKKRAGDALAFVDREAFPKLVENQRISFEKKLAEQNASNTSDQSAQ